MFVRLSWVRGVAASLGLLLIAFNAAAQGAAGSMAGVVTDATGLALPGVPITVTNEADVAIETVTDEKGEYRLPGLAAGAYRVEAVLDGFEVVLQRITVVPGQTAVLDLTLKPARFAEGIVVTARRVEEIVQEVPIPVSVVGGDLINDSGAFNVNRLKEMLPTVQFYSSNPRNSSINIRGLGTPFGLTNDGIEPGVGMYIDGAFHARPAAATLDFIDVEQVEVLRGPQGTLFGKNTTAGAISVTTKKPTFSHQTDIEINYGSLSLVQAKASVSGPLSRRVAGRLSFAGTTRDGTIYNTRTAIDLNGLNNAGLRGQLLFAPSARTAVRLTADHTRQRPDGHAQVIAGVAPTLRAADRQYTQIASDLGYVPPSLNGFDRLTDTDTPWRSHQDMGGLSFSVDREYASGTLTTISTWRYWMWRPSNDRDFVGLPITTVSANPSDQRQWTQEVRYAGRLRPSLRFVAGVFGFYQTIRSTGTQEHGTAAARFLLPPSALAATPGLLEGYGQTSNIAARTTSASAFGQLEWSLGARLRLLPGLRVNYDDKHVDFRTEVYGGLQTTDPALVALQRSILAPQAYRAGTDDTNLSGQLTAAYQAATPLNVFATYATSFKSIGLNLSGVPTDAHGNPVLSAATVKPEDVRHIEVGLKTVPFRDATANLTLFNTDTRDYQANVVNAQVGVLRGYLANAERVRVRGVEFDGTARLNERISFYGASALTDATYASFPDAPPPLEDTGGPAVKDISGSRLPGISRWAHSFGGEYSNRATVLGRPGEFFGAVDGSYRSSFSSSASVSRYLMVDGYALLNARIGFRWHDGWMLSVWSRNVLNTDYYEFLSPAPGNSGLYVGLPGEPRTVGITLRLALRSR
jgi:iron complex outermembrane receptor protein